MHRRSHLLLLILLLASFFSSLPIGVQADDPIVRAVLFYSETCPHCQVVLREVLPPLQDKYGSQFELKKIEISTSANYAILLQTEQAYNVPADKATVPEMFVGERVLYGEAEIRAQLPALIEELLQQGGVDWPQGFGEPPAPEPEARPTRPPKSCHICDEEEERVAQATSQAATAATRQVTAAATPAAHPLHLAYFYQVGCHECDRAGYDLRYLKGQYPQLVIHEFDIKEQAPLAEWLGQKNGVPPSKRLTAPAAFLGSDALLGEQVNAHNLERVIQRYLSTGAEAYWTTQSDLSVAEAGILQRFQSFGALTVVAAGLIDGLNPCAFATIVFFISYLSFVGRRGREILLVGAMFALGVFLTYLGVGIGLLKALAALPFLPAISRYLYGLTALFCLALAAGSLYDWYQMRRGRPDEMKLKLPTRLRRHINRVIREGANVQAIAGVAFLTGAVISLIELACTGQVYLPTIIFVLGVPALRVQALLYLLLYNVLFVLPLVTVFVLAYWGTTSERLGQFVNRRTGAIKLATAGLFVLLGAWMIAML